MTGNKQIRARLERAEAKTQLIRLTRVIPGVGPLEGYVSAVGEKWLLLALVDGSGLNGFVAVRIRDVERVWRKRESYRFVRRSLELDGTWPPPAPTIELDLDTTHGLIDALATAGELVMVEIEYDNPDIGFVGIPSRPRKKRFTMQETTTQGEWDDDISRWTFADVSRIDIADAYISRLSAVAGPPPA